MNVGEDTLNAPDGFSTPCPVGTRVDGYQVVVGALIYQIRPRCSCINCGAQPCTCSCCQLVKHLLGPSDSPSHPTLDLGSARGLGPPARTSGWKIGHCKGLQPCKGLPACFRGPWERSAHGCMCAQAVAAWQNGTTPAARATCSTSPTAVQTRTLTSQCPGAWWTLPHAPMSPLRPARAPGTTATMQRTPSLLTQVPHVPPQ